MEAGATAAATAAEAGATKRRRPKPAGAGIDQVCKDLGPQWDWLPDGGLYHDPYAYLESERNRPPSLHETVLASTPSANGASDATFRTPPVRLPSASDGDLAGGSNELAVVWTTDGQLGVRNEIQRDRHVGI